MKTDIAIIGGGPAAIISAITARQHNPTKDITLIRETDVSIIPCSIPYIFSRLDSCEKITAPDKPLEANKINILTAKAIKLDTTAKKIHTNTGTKLTYNKLILATGSDPIHIPIKGIDKQGIWLIKKDRKHLKKLRTAILNSKNIAIIGGGFIGVELAEELSRIKALNISIIEKLDHCLITVFDEETAIAAEEKLKQNNVKIHTNAQIQEITGENKVESIKLNNGTQIPADLIILSIGAKPNTTLAKESGLKTTEKGAICVNKHMQTSSPDIYAAGDCAQKTDSLTKKDTAILLASTATQEARIAGANLYRKERENKGTLGFFSTCISDLILSTAGLTEKRAKDEKIDIITSTAECPNHHPATLPDTQPIKVKLIFEKHKKILIGAQIICPKDTAEMINTLALAIQKKATINDLITLQISTHPLLTPAPTTYPIITAAEQALKQAH